MPLTVRSLYGYKKLTGVRSSMDDANTIALDEYIQAFTIALEYTEGPLATGLRLLSEEQKSLLIAALISNDSTGIDALLSPCLEKTDLEPLTKPLLKGIIEHDHSNSPAKGNWLNSTVTMIISKMLQADPDDINSHAGNIRILQYAMQQIPESDIRINAKILICREIDSTVHDSISDYAYNESPDPLVINRFSGNISAREFAAASQVTALDYSEYLMLTLGVLQEALASQTDSHIALNQIRELYLNTQYEEAVDKIKELSTKHKDVLGADLFKLIEDRSTPLAEVEIHKNYPRRFFENRLSQLYAGLHMNIESIDRISYRMTKKHVSNPKEAENAILYISADDSNYTIERVDELKQQSPLYVKKDRMAKDEYYDKETEVTGVEGRSDVYSRNKGILTSNAPNFYDERSEREMRNRVLDIFSTSGMKIAGYSFSKPRAAFAGSLSGHFIGIVASLENYMKTYSTEKNLSADINHFLMAVVTSYINRGYHGFSEMIDILLEAHIKKVFTECGVQLDFYWLDELIEKASKDTQEYTKVLCLREAVDKEILMVTANALEQASKRDHVKAFKTVLDAIKNHGIVDVENKSIKPGRV